MTDVNSMQYQSTSSHLGDENNRSFTLNESNIPMDIDDDAMVTDTPKKVNGHISPTIFDAKKNEIHHEQESENDFRPTLSRNPVLNKSFDVLPQVKDENIPTIDPTSEQHEKSCDVLDTTVELPNHGNDSYDKPSHFDDHQDIGHVEAPTISATLLSNQFSLEYPYVVPQPAENIRSSSPEPIGSVTTSIKAIKLNIAKAFEGQEDSLQSNSILDKGFDTNTFVLKKKDRRKVAASAVENGFNASYEDTPPDSFKKQSPFNTPSGSFDSSTISRPAVTVAPSLQQISIDPTRIIECVEQYYRILHRVCECTEELKQELRQVKSERDQMSEDLINAENAYTDVKKRNEKLKLIINEHKTNTETLKRFSEESVRYTEEQKQKYAVLKQHAQEKLNEANSEIERLRRTHSSEMEGVQAQLRYAQLRVQSLEQELKSVKQELEQKKKENIELTNICDELLATNKR